MTAKKRLTIVTLIALPEAPDPHFTLLPMTTGKPQLRRPPVVGGFTELSRPHRIEIVGDHSRMQQGSLARQDSLKLPDDALMPKTLTFRYTAKVMKLFTARGVVTGTFGDYHKFQVQSNIVDFTEKR